MTAELTIPFKERTLPFPKDEETDIVNLGREAFKEITAVLTISLDTFYLKDNETVLLIKTLAVPDNIKT